MVIHPDNVPDEAIEILRPAFAHFGVDGGEAYTPEHWIQRCKEDSAQLWRSEDGAYWAVTQVFNTAKGRVLHAVAGAGQYRDSVREECEAWARSVGCVRARFEGRPGWHKYMPEYRVIAMTYEKEL